MSTPGIESYGVIGDLYTIALVGMNGSIDFLCLPDFDSPSVFAAILDPERGGRFTICPSLEDANRKQLYLPDTNVLLTRFLSSQGVAEITDFMPIEGSGQEHTLHRRVRVIRGKVEIHALCDPRFDYGRGEHRTRAREDGVVFEAREPKGLRLFLRSSIPLRVREGAAVAVFSLEAGEQVDFVLEHLTEEPREIADLDGLSTRRFGETVAYWREWIGRTPYHGRWSDMVHRSALTLKLLFSNRHGSMVAAPTFGLPEEIGGERNWDYRFTWIRDASFTLYGLLRLGFTEEAGRFMKWIMARCEELEEDGSLQIMYGLDGRHDLVEEELPHLRGYRDSRPVRIGNGAYRQLQLDIYGELMDAVYLYDKYGEPIHYGLWRNLVRLVEWVCRNWDREDEGIWEVRGGRHHFLYSRLMCWVAVDRALRLSRKRSLPAPFERWRDVRDEIHRQIHTEFWNDSLGAFVQTRGGEALDASCLLMPLVRFISPTDPRWLSTLEAIDRELVDDALVHRYKIGTAVPDGLEGREGTFNMCSFWYVECLARAGRLEDARLNLEKMHGYANHLGLYSEELGPAGEHLGNFPQAFTHLGLISAAHFLDRVLSKAGWRA
ncbi:MAG: glycoside hydrolase family 15 protein [Candidatus Eisenbacteria bacterium]|nr:glycoside hydrolase family 15 protein [Candidatus Latescibacterota bacterium]MBD3303108.1 glycoside hydrolase family 15 protein [Candidatus Eisenbacteria bacterium]